MNNISTEILIIILVILFLLSAFFSGSETALMSINKYKMRHQAKLNNKGAKAAKKIAFLGFDVAGWSKSQKDIKNVKSFFGENQLEQFLGRTDILCCLLPLTPETNGILNREALNKLPNGAYIINAGRGPHIVDEDLLDAIDSGQIAGVALDVFHQEPLPEAHPYWMHPKVRVWPHVSAQSNAGSAAKQVADAITKVFGGKDPDNLINRKNQY